MSYQTTLRDLPVVLRRLRLRAGHTSQRSALAAIRRQTGVANSRGPPEAGNPTSGFAVQAELPRHRLGFPVEARLTLPRRLVGRYARLRDPGLRQPRRPGDEIDLGLKIPEIVAEPVQETEERAKGGLAAAHLPLAAAAGGEAQAGPLTDRADGRALGRVAGAAPQPREHHRQDPGRVAVALHRAAV